MRIDITLENFVNDVGKKVYEMLPDSLIEMMDLTEQSVTEDLQGELNDDFNLLPKYDQMTVTSDDGWSRGFEVEEFVNTIFPQYYKALTT